MVISSGAMKLMAIASAIGIWRTPRMKKMPEPTRQKPRAICILRLFTASMRVFLPGLARHASVKAKLTKMT